MRGATRALAALAGILAAAAGPGVGHAGSAHVDYMLECQGCHLADGSGSPGAVPDLRASLPALLRTPAGRGYLVRVPGSASSPLSDAELAAVLNWMVASFAGDAAAAEFAPYTAAEVAAQRSLPLLRVEALRARLLRAAAAEGVY